MDECVTVRMTVGLRQNAWPPLVRGRARPCGKAAGGSREKRRPGAGTGTVNAVRVWSRFQQADTQSRSYAVWRRFRSGLRANRRRTAPDRPIQLTGQAQRPPHGGACRPRALRRDQADRSGARRVIVIRRDRASRVLEILGNLRQTGFPRRSALPFDPGSGGNHPESERNHDRDDQGDHRGLLESAIGGNHRCQRAEQPGGFSGRDDPSARHRILSNGNPTVEIRRGLSPKPAAIGGHRRFDKRAEDDIFGAYGRMSSPQSRRLV